MSFNANSVSAISLSLDKLGKSQHTAERELSNAVSDSFLTSSLLLPISNVSQTSSLPISTTNLTHTSFLHLAILMSSAVIAVCYKTVGWLENFFSTLLTTYESFNFINGINTLNSHCRHIRFLSFINWGLELK